MTTHVFRYKYPRLKWEVEHLAINRHKNAHLIRPGDYVYFEDIDRWFINKERAQYNSVPKDEVPKDFRLYLLLVK
jgi:hypothetical protein